MYYINFNKKKELCRVVWIIIEFTFEHFPFSFVYLKRVLLLSISYEQPQMAALYLRHLTPLAYLSPPSKLFLDSSHFCTHYTPRRKLRFSTLIMASAAKKVPHHRHCSRSIVQKLLPPNQIELSFCNV